jgi:hypothetical protein
MTKETVQEPYNMSEHPHLIEKNPDTARTDANWRDGSLSYDLSQDETLARAGDEDAAARLRTRRRLEHGRRGTAYSAV